MNIFFLDVDPSRAAQAQCDVHVRKMIVETAQLLCTAHHRIGVATEWMYKPYNINSRFVSWILESEANYRWLYNHFLALNTEYYNRSSKVHASIRDRNLDNVLAIIPVKDPFPLEVTIPACAFGEWPNAPQLPLSTISETVDTYRKYYRYKYLQWRGLGITMKWTNAASPIWLNIE